MSDIPNLKEEKYFEGKISIREFLVDFFGALMPGVFFLLFVTTTFFIPLYALLQTVSLLIDNDVYNFEIFISEDHLSLLGKFPVAYDIGILFLFLAFGYIIGMIFYRLDPKIPDFKSFKKVIDMFEYKEGESWVVTVKKKADDNIEQRINKIDVQYPYKDLREYFKARYRPDLAEKIYWDSSTPEEEHRRSKIFINALKIRLQFYFPQQCSTILKNEAHIRLSSSMWFVCTSLLRFCIIGLSLIITTSLILLLRYPASFKDNLLGLLIIISLTILILLLVIKIKSSIEKFLHYQRVREIFYVLETAMTASKAIEDGDKKIWG